MLIPHFWASAKRRHRAEGRQLTLQRWGWSQVSQEQAQQHSEQRVEEAMAAALQAWPESLSSVLRRERKTPYNGAEGLPIREEILIEQGLDVLTRNSYGAHCLNTPDVMFVDVDDEWVARAPRAARRPLLWVILALATLWWGLWAMSPAGTPAPCRCNPDAVPSAWAIARHLGWGAIWRLALTALAATWLWHRIWKAYVSLQGGTLGMTRKALARLLKTDPVGRWSLYATPRGVRLLALHSTFDPTDPTSIALMEQLGSDPLYLLMCRRQACFRARVSAKPWRIPGLNRLRGPTWPVTGDALGRRQEWVASYEARQPGFAACRWLETHGSETVDPRPAQVAAWHDELAQARTDKPLA